MKTVLITGASTGIGKAAAVKFAEAGWNVAATMRNPEKVTSFAGYKNIKCYRLDVTDPETIKCAFDNVLKNFGEIDALVNNAGYAVDGVFEAMSDEVIEKQFDTNVFGLMRVTREAIKLMKHQNGGTIIQVASMGGRLAFPLLSIYHATKWAVEGFTESLSYELKQFNIKVKLIEPGVIKTDFYGRSMKFVKPEQGNEYDQFIMKVDKVSQRAGNSGESPEKVANAILKAAEDNSNKLRYVTGSPAPSLLFLRNLLPDFLFSFIVKASYKI